MFLLDSNTCQEMSANICLVDYLSFMTVSKSQEKRVKRVLLVGVLEVLLKDNVSTNYVAIVGRDLAYTHLLAGKALTLHLSFNSR